MTGHDISIPADVAARLEQICGKGGVLTRDTDIAPYLTDWRGLYTGRSACVLRPSTTEAVASAVALLAESGIPIVPIGGNTSMVGGATADDTGRQVVLSLARLNSIRDIDPVDGTMVAEAGVILQNAQDAARDAGLFFPLSLASEGSATIGGALSTNAGGNTTVRYGNARELMLGLEVVLPDGSIWHGLRRLRKDNTGYALRHLFVGAEGTLGIITAASLRLFPQPVTEETALCALSSEAAVLALFRRLRETAEPALRAFEYMSGDGLRLVLKHIEGASDPFNEPATHYVLIDLAVSRADETLRGMLETLLGEALEAGEISDAVVAASSSQRAALWRLREEHSEAQRREGASIKNDISVPVSRVPDMIVRAREACEHLIPGIRAVPFGHVGDGNIHLNFMQPTGMAAADFLGLHDDIVSTVNNIVCELGGSFSAEHGIGRLKATYLRKWHDGVEMDVMKKIKNCLDPDRIMNPRVLFT